MNQLILYKHGYTAIIHQYEGHSLLYQTQAVNEFVVIIILDG